LKNSIELNSTLKSLTSHANEFGFKQFSQIEKYTIKDEGEDVITQSQKTIYKFSSRGPIYSLASVIPGLGLRLMHPNKESKYRNGGIKNALLISSISLGVVSLASKIYSNYHYKIYKNDPFAENEKFHYSRSNTAQKIFVSSGIAYCVLGAIDFTWTFTLGCKNKNIQHRLNKHLTKSPSSLILY
jgi:hypothetical protein